MVKKYLPTNTKNKTEYFNVVEKRVCDARNCRVKQSKNKNGGEGEKHSEVTRRRTKFAAQ